MRGLQVARACAPLPRTCPPHRPGLGDGYSDPLPTPTVPAARKPFAVTAEGTSRLSPKPSLPLPPILMPPPWALPPARPHAPTCPHVASALSRFWTCSRVAIWCQDRRYSCRPWWAPFIRATASRQFAFRLSFSGICTPVSRRSVPSAVPGAKWTWACEATGPAPEV